ncbi:hypothetical protein K7H22_07345 [Seohaeicola saemankumensis]|nr:hypothetical protein [Seohaeicola saemankumensis]
MIAPDRLPGIREFGQDNSMGDAAFHLATGTEASLAAQDFCILFEPRS